MEILKKYLPELSLGLVFDIIKKNNIHFKVTPHRKSKNGSFKVPNIIRVSSSLNKYAFLITTIHEISHYFAFKKYNSSILPHGLEWKYIFRNLMYCLPIEEIFPQDILIPLENYLKNPKASTCSDIKLYLALKKYDLNYSEKLTLNELLDGDKFYFKEKKYLKIKKRQKLILCKKESNGKFYLFKPYVEIQNSI